MDYEDKLTHIDIQLKEIDDQLDKLKKLKQKLINERENFIDKKNLAKSKELSRKDWENNTYPWSSKVYEKLRDVFKIQNFRQKQLETINATLSKHDILFVAPTGGGKSLCYQLPALIENGITLVISPLISLMEDQLRTLKAREINAKILYAQSTKEESREIHKILEDSNRTSEMKLLYVTPERLSKSKRFMQALQKCYHLGKLDRVAIDEVHSVSMLGHDFRPDYKFLKVLKELFPNTPILGVTATATENVLKDVQKILDIRECIIFKSPFNRPNLYYHVIEKPSEAEAVYNILTDLLMNRYKGECGIIYTFSTKDADTIALNLRERDVKVRSYHAQLEPAKRTKIYNEWINGSIQAVVATIAFGMGIDKPNVRFVIHHTISKSMENFYQESGRCGRDGKYAESILMYRMADMFKISCMTFTETGGLKNAYSMINYAINSKECRRDQFSNHFSETWDDKACGKMCDCCFYRNLERVVKPPVIDIFDHYKSILRILDKAKSSDTKLTALKLIDAWFQKGPKASRVDDMSSPNIDRHYGEQILTYLLVNDYLREDFHYTAYSTNSYVVQGNKILTSNDVNFNPSRIYDLPPLNDLKNYYEEVSRPPSSYNRRSNTYDSTPTTSSRGRSRDYSNHNHYGHSDHKKRSPPFNNYNRYNDRSRDSPRHQVNHGRSFSSGHSNNRNFSNHSGNSNNYHERQNMSNHRESNYYRNDSNYRKRDSPHFNRSHHDSPAFGTYSNKKRKFSDDEYEDSAEKRSNRSNEKNSMLDSNVSSTIQDRDDDVILVEFKKENVIDID